MFTVLVFIIAQIETFGPVVGKLADLSYEVTM